MWWVFSCSESFRLLEWQAENLALGQGPSREQYPVGSRFSELLFLYVPGTATEQVRTCGFRRKTSSLDKALEIHQSVQLNSREVFSRTISSISWEIWVIYSSTIPVLSVFCDWLFLVFSGVNRGTAANFLLFLNVAITLREKLCKLWKLNWFFTLLTKKVDLLCYEGKGFQQKQTVNDVKLSTITSGYKFILW